MLRVADLSLIVPLCADLALMLSLSRSLAAMIDGLEEGLTGMRAGGTRRLVVPSRIGYRDRSHEPIPRDWGNRNRLYSTVLNTNRLEQERLAPELARLPMNGLPTVGTGNVAASDASGDVVGTVCLDVELLFVRPPVSEGEEAKSG